MKTVGPFSVIILAAGSSTRMNFPKPFLPFSNGRTFIEKIIDTYADAGITDIILVINAGIENKMRTILSKKDQSKTIKIIVNRNPERGRFFSIQSGLQQVSSNFCFLQNIDNPFITITLLNEMMKVVSDSNYVVPVFGSNEGHPVLLSNKIWKHLLSLKGDTSNLRNELNFFTKAKVNWFNSGILANINTAEEYQRYFSSVATIA